MANRETQLRHVMVAEIGAAPDFFELERWMRFSTNGRRGDTAGWLKVFEGFEAAIFGCHRQGISRTWKCREYEVLNPAEGAALRLKIEQAKAERSARQRQLWATNRERINRLLADSRPPQPGDPLTLYLKRRGLGGLWPLPACLRLHRSLGYWHEGRELGRFPAMLAPIVAPDGQTVALHRTYLTQDGRKADVPTPKKVTTAAGPLAGASIPLGQVQNGLIGIAEGIETALAAWAGSGVPVVAAYCAHSLATWQWPAAARRIVVFADHDRAGLEAAEALRVRSLKTGLRCEVHSPTEPGQDWADVWLSGQAPLIGLEVQA